MSGQRTSDELWLGAALDEIESRRGPGPWRPPQQTPPRRRLRLALALALTASAAVGAILVPQLALGGGGIGARPLGASFCRVALPTTWESAISQSRQLVPEALKAPDIFAVAPDQQVYFADFYSASWSGILEVAPDTKTVHQVYQFPSAQDRVYGGAFDGRYLIWTLAPSQRSGHAGTLMEWDSSTDRVSTLIPEQPAGTNIEFTLDQTPAAQGKGLLEWTVVPSSDSTYTLADLSAGLRDRLYPGIEALAPLHQGQFLGDDFLYWARTTAGGSEEGAVVMGTWKVASVPHRVGEELAALSKKGVQWGWLDGAGALWAGPKGAVYAWPKSARRPSRLQVAGAGAFLAEAGRVGVWVDPTDMRLYAADLSTRSYTELDQPAGWVGAPAGNQLAIFWTAQNTRLSLQPRTAMALLDTAQLPDLSGCRSAGGR